MADEQDDDKKQPEVKGSKQPEKADETKKEETKPKVKGPKIGAGHLTAMGRLGLSELRNAFNPSKESVADSEIGLYGTATQGEIAEAREPPAMSLEEMRAAAKELAAQKAKENEGKQNDDKSRGR